MVEMVERVLNGQYRITLPLHRAERPEWFCETGWEKPRMEALTKCIRERGNPVLYYVGAEEGELCAICALQGAELVMFEPNPRVWANIKAVWEANNLSDPVWFPGFASNVSAMKGVGPRSGFYGDLGEVVGDHGFKELYQEADNFPQVRLDDVWQVMGYPPPQIISFDVEGSEWRVLEGAVETLSRYRPVVFASIHPEFMFHQWGEYSADFRKWIKDFGYREEILDYQHELHTVYYPL